MFLRVRFNTSTLSWSLYPSKTESIPSSIRDTLDAVSLILLIFIAFSGFSMISHRCALSSESSIPKTLHKFLTEFNGNEHIASPCHFRYCKIFPYVRAQVVCTFITGLPIPHCIPPLFLTTFMSGAAGCPFIKMGGGAVSSLSPIPS
jgi:hypothetical protein